MAMAVVERWWNGLYGTMTGQRIRIVERGGAWSVESDGPSEAFTVTPCEGLEQARTEVERQRLEAGGTWRRIDL